MLKERFYIVVEPNSSAPALLYGALPGGALHYGTVADTTQAATTMRSRHADAPAATARRSESH